MTWPPIGISGNEDHGLNVDSDVLGKHEAWRPYRGLFLGRRVVSHRLISLFPCDPVVASAQEAADRQYRFIVCTFK